MNGRSGFFFCPGSKEEVCEGSKEFQSPVPVGSDLGRLGVGNLYTAKVNR